jgi:CheY-like chemotaxis protein
MDVAMPQMNGLDATRAIRENEAAEAAVASRIVGLTAHSSPQDRVACLGAGMDSHMSKPVSLSYLRTLLAEVAIQRA